MYAALRRVEVCAPQRYVKFLPTLAFVLEARASMRHAGSSCKGFTGALDRFNFIPVYSRSHALPFCPDTLLLFSCFVATSLPAAQSLIIMAIVES